MPRTVTLVDEKGAPVGLAEIVEAHTGHGKLHKAFSVYVFRNDGKEILIQQRSTKKMLWPMIWANTCCSHPLENESPTDAGERRLKEELGFTTKLQPHSEFIYRAVEPSGRGIEHEHVTILVGNGDNIEVAPNPDEVAEYKWTKVTELQEDMQKNFDAYAPWFHLGLDIITGNDQPTN